MLQCVPPADIGGFETGTAVRRTYRQDTVEVGSELKRKREYEDLKRRLAAAVKDEDYETAAKLHKRIREMENEVKKS